LGNLALSNRRIKKRESSHEKECLTSKEDLLAIDRRNIMKKNVIGKSSLETPKTICLPLHQTRSMLSPGLVALSRGNERSHQQRKGEMLQTSGKMEKRKQPKGRDRPTLRKGGELRVSEKIPTGRRAEFFRIIEWCAEA